MWIGNRLISSNRDRLCQAFVSYGFAAPPGVAVIRSSLFTTHLVLERRESVQSVSLRIHVDAPVERVWNLISDHEGYIRLTDVTSAELLREGKVERNGIGKRRGRFTLGE